MKQTNNCKRAAWLAGMILWGLSGSSWAGPLHDAAAVSNNAEKIQQLIDSDGEDVDGVDENGDTALHIAGRLGLLGNVKTLTQRGANPRAINQKSSLKRTPLREAFANGHLETAKYLVIEVLGDGNAQIGLTKPDRTGKAPAHEAMWEGTEEIVRWVLGELENHDLTQLIDKARRTLLHFAARNEQCPEAVRLVIGCDLKLLNVQDKFKMTPLDWTVKSGINNIEAARQHQQSLFGATSPWRQWAAFLILLANGAEFGKEKIKKTDPLCVVLGMKDRLECWKSEFAELLSLHKILKTKKSHLKYLVSEFEKFENKYKMYFMDGYSGKRKEKAIVNDIKVIIYEYIGLLSVGGKVRALQSN